MRRPLGGELLRLVLLHLRQLFLCTGVEPLHRRAPGTRPCGRHLPSIKGAGYRGTRVRQPRPQDLIARLTKHARTTGPSASRGGINPRATRSLEGLTENPERRLACLQPLIGAE